MKSLFPICSTFMFLLFIFSASAQDGRISSVENYDFTSNKTAAKYYNKAVKQFNHGNFLKTVRFYKKAIQEDPLFVEAYDNIGLTFRQLDFLDSAERYYKLSLGLYPMGKVAHQNLAVVEDKRGNYKEAINYYNQLISLDPEDPEGYYGRGRMYFALEEYQLALEDGLLAEKYYIKAGGGYIQDSHYSIALAYYYLNYMENAKKYFLMARKGGVVIPQKISETLKIE